MMTESEIVLASGSPRRSEILRQLGVNFRVVVSGEDEKPTSTNPLDFPRENACIKALSVSRQERDAYVLGFDTLVFWTTFRWASPNPKQMLLKC